MDVCSLTNQTTKIASIALQISALRTFVAQRSSQTDAQRITVAQHVLLDVAAPRIGEVQLS